MKLLTRYRTRMAMPGRDEETLARLKVTCWRESYPGLLPQPLLDSDDDDDDDPVVEVVGEMPVEVMGGGSLSPPGTMTDD